VNTLSVVIAWASIGLYFLIFALWHWWILPSYNIAKAGNVLTRSQKIAMRLFPYVASSAIFAIFVFFMSIIFFAVTVAVK